MHFSVELSSFLAYLKPSELFVIFVNQLKDLPISKRFTLAVCLAILPSFLVVHRVVPWFLGGSWSLRGDVVLPLGDEESARENQTWFSPFDEWVRAGFMGF
jgi:hypothetical protein